MEEKIVHTHWLYGKGDGKTLEFKHPVRENSKCYECFHREVCTRDEGKRCVNYNFSNSDGTTSCGCCIHQYTKYDRTPIPCFYCKEFITMPMEWLIRDLEFNIQFVNEQMRDMVNASVSVATPEEEAEYKALKEKKEQYEKRLAIVKENIK